MPKLSRGTLIPAAVATEAWKTLVKPYVPPKCIEVLDHFTEIAIEAHFREQVAEAVLASYGTGLTITDATESWWIEAKRVNTPP